MILKLSEKVQNQIKQLCNAVSRVEWSGTLFYSIESGSYEEKNCVLLAEEIFLQDIGSEGYTEYEFGPEFFSMIKEKSYLLDCLQAHAHSHHSMNTFFSATDTQELFENSENHNHYLSLIVNNRGDMCAKVAFREFHDLSIESTITKRDTNGNLISAGKSVESKKDFKVYAYDCIIIKKEEELDLELAKRIQELQTIKQQRDLEIKNKFQQYNNSNKNTFNGLHKPGFIDRDKVINMLITWLNQDYLAVKPLNNTLASINKKTEGEWDEYTDNLFGIYRSHYLNMFPDDISCDEIQNVSDKAIEILKIYLNIYPDIILSLVSTIEDATVDELIGMDEFPENEILGL